jgi:predicted acetyltransferase
MRGKGYGHLILKLGLTKARSIGLKRLTIACNENNIASRRIIEHSGGVLLRRVQVPGELGAMRIYKIKATQSGVVN